MQQYTKRLAAFAAGIKYEELPSGLVEVLKRSLLDTLGCAVAGSVRPEIVCMKNALICPEETGEGTVWMDGRAVPMTTALMINGSMNHAVELDDLHKPSKIHAGTVIVPPIMTVGAAGHISGKELICAMAAGYEVTLRVAIGIGVDSHRRRGWHGTATCGSFGAAAALGRMLGMDGDQIASALGLAGTSTGGLMAYTADGSMSKRYHAGNAAVNGWNAVRCAGAGYAGPTYVLEAPDGGYAHAVSDRFDLDEIIDGLGEMWHSSEMGLKFYACCGHIHQAIDCAIRLREQYGFEPEDIDSVLVRTYDVSGMSWGFTRPPANTVEAQFSFPYAVSVALIDGAAFLPQFSQQRLNDEKINSLAAKVKVVTDEKYTARYPKEWCSGLEIVLTDGRVLTTETCGAKGDPVNPLSREEVRTKFLSLTDGLLNDSAAKRMIELAENIEQIDDVSLVGELMNG